MSPVRMWGDPDEEAASVARSRQSWDRILAARQTVTANDARAVSTMAANYPHMSPGTVVPLVQAGVAPDDPLTQHVAVQEAKANHKKGRGLRGALGDLIGGIANIPAAAMDFGVSNVLNPVGGAALDVAKPALRTGLAGAMFLPEAGMGVLRNVADVGGEIVAGAASGAAVGATAGLAGGPFAPISVAAGVIGGAAIGAGAGALAQARGVNIESAGGLENPLAQTTLGQAVAGKSLGSGYMPGGEAAQAQAESARRSAAINGHALTPGRFLASSVLEEGTGAYNLLSGAMDASVAWKLDPTAAGLKAVGAARKGARTLAATEKEVQAALRAGRLERQEAGLVDGARKTIIGEKVDKWLGTERGSKTLDWFAENDFETIRKTLGKDKVDVDIVRRLSKATTREEVDAILRPELGLARGLEVKPRVGGYGMTIKQGMRKLPGGESRLWNDLPSGDLDYSRPTEAVNQFNLLLNDANVLGDDAAKFTEEFADLMIDGSHQARRQADALVYRSLIQGIGSKIDQSGKAVEFLGGVARRAADGDAQMMQSLINEDVTKTVVKAVSLGGETHGLVDAGFLMSHADAGITVDRTVLRDIRSATSRYSRLLNNPKVKLTGAAAQHFTDDVWKPMALLRGAWTVRVIGEEQIRMAAAGRNSLFNHPLSYLSWAMDDESRIGQLLAKAKVKTGMGATTFEGERFAKEGTTIVSAADEVDAALLDRADSYAAGLGIDAQAGGWAGDGHISAAHKETYVKGQKGHVEGVAEKIDQAHSDPVLRMLATQPRHVVRKWFMEGEGNQYRQALIKKHNAPLRSLADVDKHLDDAQKQLNTIMGRIEGAGQVPASALTGTSPMAPGQVAQLQQARQAARPGSAAIRQAIADGEINGVPLRDAKGRVNKGFVDELNKVEDLPDKITASAQRVPDKLYQAKRDAAVQRWFTNLMSKPSARLSRSPMFRQSYWAEADNLITELEPAAQARLIANAETAKLDKEAIRRLRDRAKVSSGDLKLHEADLVAKGRALDQTQDLLYDAAKRGQMSDALRIIMPFAEAQKEVMKTWATIGTKTNPAAIRRAQQFLQGARGSGVFYKDPTTGEEMFTFPFSAWATEHIPGLDMPIPLTGRVAGLNTFGSGIIPGMGPAVQITARTLLADKPQYDDLHKFIDPLGSSAGQTEGVLEQQFPSWLTSAKRAFTANDSDRTFANAVKDVWAQGVSAGRYGTSTPEEIQEGMDSARRNARILFMIKGLASVGGAPTPPSPSFMAMDKDGKWHMAKVLSEDYRKMVDDPEIGFDGASAAFLEKYGNNAFAFMQAKTYATVPSAPSTVDYRQWTGTAEGQAAAKFKDIGALFGPQGEGFDYNTYLRNIKSGDTVNLTPEQFTEQTNNRLATMIYYNQRDKFGPTPSKEQRAWLADLKDQLRDKFPGYGVELPGKPTADKAKNEYIPAIAKAVNDPALADNDVARAAKLYLQARSAALESVKAAGGTSFESSKAAAPIRDWLRQILDQLTDRVPDFAPMAERVFGREMQDDEEVTQVAAGVAG